LVRCWRCAARSSAQAQAYPNRTIRIVVPYAAGGGVSMLAQISRQQDAGDPEADDRDRQSPRRRRQPRRRLVAKSPPDGYTILLHSSAMASASSLYAKLPFDPVKDFVPVTMVISTQFVIGGSPKNPATNLRELSLSPKKSPAP
jgi:tripartite-type tricarboxylate transporter receptor subunit TctC